MQTDGGPAFPLAGSSGGMTLRDWFAGMNLPNIHESVSLQHAARTCYQVADAMLAEREKSRE